MRSHRQHTLSLQRDVDEFAKANAQRFEDFADPVGRKNQWRRGTARTHPNTLITRAAAEDVIEVVLLVLREGCAETNLVVQPENVGPSVVPNPSQALIQTELDSIIGEGTRERSSPYLHPVSVQSSYLPSLWSQRYVITMRVLIPWNFCLTLKNTLDNRGCTSAQIYKLFPEYLEEVDNE